MIIYYGAGSAECSVNRSAEKNLTIVQLSTCRNRTGDGACSEIDLSVILTACIEILGNWAGLDFMFQVAASAGRAGYAGPRPAPAERQFVICAGCRHDFALATPRNAQLEQGTRS